MTHNALEIRDLQKEFRSDLLKKRFKALHGISFDVHEGEIFGYVGHNGAGKTTTIKITCGLIFADAGTVKIFGKDCTRPEARLPLGYLPEHPYFYDYLTPVEALKFYGGLSGLTSREIEKKIPALLDEVNLGFAANQRLRGFSKGMLQRLGMAQALVHDPALLILDEPMSGLDPLGRKMMRDIILEQKRKGRTVFFSSHVLSDVEEISDRVGIIIRGKMRDVGEIHSLLGPPQRFEFVFSALNEQQRSLFTAPAAPLQKGDVWYVTVEGESARDATMALIRANELPMIQFNAKRKSLEEFFVEAMGTN